MSNRVSRRQASRWAEQQAAAPEPQPGPAPEMYARTGQAPPDMIEQLKELGQLHEQGILTDQEFAEQKARVLGH